MGLCIVTSREIMPGQIFGHLLHYRPDLQTCSLFSRFSTSSARLPAFGVPAERGNVAAAAAARARAPAPGWWRLGDDSRSRGATAPRACAAQPAMATGEGTELYEELIDDAAVEGVRSQW